MHSSLTLRRVHRPPVADWRARPSASRQQLQLALGLVLALICLIEHCDCKLLPISRPSIYGRPSSYNVERLDGGQFAVDPADSERFAKFTGEVSSPDFRKELFFKTIQSASNSLSASKKRSNVNTDETQYSADKKATNDDLSASSEAIIEMPANQMSLSNFLDSSLVVYKVNNLSDFDSLNQTTNRPAAIEPDSVASDPANGQQPRSDVRQPVKDGAMGSEDGRQEERLREEQERVLKQIDQINAGHICSSLNKQTHFKANKDSSAKNNRDKRYWLLVKALEPKFVPMPAIAGQVQPSLEIKNYYRELIEKLELITSILYDNNAEQLSAVHNLQLSRKVIREIAFLHPHILR